MAAAKIAQANYYADLIPAARRGTVVQAGGNVGAYPITLAKRFERVVSFEPSKILFECLNANTNRDVLCPPDIRNRLLICNAALGAAEDNVAMNYDRQNCEATHVEKCHQPSDAVQMIPLDRLSFRACDLILLDIEGYELPALDRRDGDDCAAPPGDRAGDCQPLHWCRALRLHAAGFA